VEQWLHHRVVRAALDRECDAVITVEATLAPEAVAALRRQRLPVALWYPDCVVNLGAMRMLTAPFTSMFFKDPLLVQRLRAMLDVPVEYLPQACNPRWHRPVGDAATQPVIAVVGNLYPSRALLLRRLHEAGVPLMIYGGPVPSWLREQIPPGLHAGYPVFRMDKSRVFREATAVLNNLAPGEMHSVNLRLFEATAAGAAVLCERRPALGELYDVGREVLAFDDFDGLVELARRLLKQPREAVAIGDAGSVRAHAEHTYEQRLPAILRTLG
jgi:spore maturation protein CgeB